MTAPDLRTAAQALLDAVDMYGECPFCGSLDDEHQDVCPGVALRAALAVEATEPPPDRKPWTFDVNYEGGPTWTDYGTGVEWDGSYQWAIYDGPHEIDDAVLAGWAPEDPTRVLTALVAEHNRAFGSAPNPQGADEPREVEQLRHLGDTLRDASMPMSVRWTNKELPTEGEIQYLMRAETAWLDYRLSVIQRLAAAGGVPDEPGDDDFPTTAAVLDSLEDIEQFHDDADMQTAAGVARLALIGYRDRYVSLLAEVERLREDRDGWKAIAERCQAGTITVTGDTLDAWLDSLRSGNDVIFGHAEANGLAAEIERLRAAAEKGRG